MKKIILSLLISLMVCSNVYAYNVAYYWGNNTNYPRIFSSNDLDYFVDKKSMIIKDRINEGLGSTTYVVGINIIGVDFQGYYEPRTFSKTFMAVISTDGSYILYKPEVGKDGENYWVEMTKETAGNELYLYNTAQVLIQDQMIK